MAEASVQPSPPGLKRPWLSALIGGLFVASSLEPLGIWPLGIVGISLLIVAMLDARSWHRFVVASCFSLAWIVPGLWWSWHFTAVGAVLLMLVEAAIIALVLAASPHGNSGLWSIPAALVVATGIRDHLPLGGLPIADLAQGQVSGPLLQSARLGTPLLVCALTAIAGAALVAIVQGPRPAGLFAALGLIILVSFSSVAPDGGAPTRSIKVAAVQGGGARGLSALAVDPNTVLAAHLKALAKVHDLAGGLVLLPEDVDATDAGIGGTPAEWQIRQEAKRLHATVLIGVTKEEAGHHFTNAVVGFGPDGQWLGTIVKRHRVPFGEYVPFRKLLSKFVNLDQVPNDATIGKGNGVLPSPAGPIGVSISYEVFYDRLARVEAQHGAQLLSLPTNASSYPSPQIPSLEIAAAQLDAVTAGRDLVQAAPTGYSALITNRGSVLQRSQLGEQAVLTGRLTLRQGETIASVLGAWPFFLLALGLLLLAWLRAKRYS
ncbi:MAG: apolipoprotein N-acyltransferase [Actinomycetota bacterium]